MVPDLSGLIYVFLFLWGVLVLLHILVVGLAGYIVGRRDGAKTGLIMGLASSPIVFLACMWGWDFLFIFLVVSYITANAIFSTVMIARARKRG